MRVERINDPTKIEPKEITRILAGGAIPTLQFSRPGYSPHLLKKLNSLCRELGSQIEVRFYGHYREGFDAAVLSNLPDVQWLSVDCLSKISNEDQLWHLPKLNKLSFGVHEFDRPDFLSGFPLEQMTRFVIVENKKRNLDLAPLERCEILDDLFINGHVKNIDVIANLAALKTLSLSSIPKRLALPFVNDVHSLRNLSLCLGGRESIDEIRHHSLEQLRVIRVRGLNTLGDLSRLPALRVLHVEDQIKLESMSLSGVSLHELFVHNCKTLTRIGGLDAQSELAHLRISRTALDLDALLERDWPETMDVLALYSSKQSWNNAARARLDQLGYREFRHR